MSDEKPPRADERFMVSLPRELAEWLRERARREMTPVSVLVRRWIREKRDDEARRD